MTATARSKSVKKPTDHKPATDDTVKVKYKDVEFTAAAGSLSQLRTLDLLERNQFTTALRHIVGDETFEAFLDKVPDATAEDAGELLELIAEKAGSKN